MKITYVSFMWSPVLRVVMHYFDDNSTGTPNGLLDIGLRNVLWSHI